MRQLGKWITLMLTCMFCSAQNFETEPQFPSVLENLTGVKLFNATFRSSACNVTNVYSLQDFVNITNLASAGPGTWTFDVNLIKALDREKSDIVMVNLLGQGYCGGGVIQDMGLIAPQRVMVIDQHDTAPEFPNSIYTFQVLEDSPVNATVGPRIRATDQDEAETLTCIVNFEDYQKSIFRYEVINDLSDECAVDIYLQKKLDFEERRSHTFTITVIDVVGMNSTCTVVLNVVNIQDTPPAFSAPQYNARVKENAIPGTTVLTVSAIDGDSEDPQHPGPIANEIEYSIISGAVGMFAINGKTGAITTFGELDIDNNTQVTNGLVVMTVMATEKNTSGQTQHGGTTTTVEVLVQVEDANDNEPKFNLPSYSGNIREDAVMDELVTIEGGNYISVSDMDQAPSNNRFSIHIEKDGKPWDLFRPNIQSQYSQASLLILLNKEDGLMNMGDTHITFQIVAQDIGNNSKNVRPSTAEMVVWVKARTTPAPAPEPVINLPLTTADIIVFIVGILLLLNIIMTIFICYVMRGGRASPFSVFNRNSKYYVSGSKKKPDAERAESPGSSNAVSNGEVSGARNTTVESSKTTPSSSESNTATKIEDIRIQTGAAPLTNTVASAADRNRCDVTPIEDRDKKSADAKEAQERSQAALLNLLSEGSSSDRCDVTPLGKSVSPTANKSAPGHARQHSYASMKGLQQSRSKDDELSNEGPNSDGNKSSTDNTQGKTTASGTSQQDRIDVIPIEQSPSALQQGLSNILQRVHHKLGQGTKFDQGKKDDACDLRPLHKKTNSLDSNVTDASENHSSNSSFSEKAAGDVVPLIKPTSTKSRGDKASLQGQQNPAFGRNSQNAKDGSNQKNLYQKLPAKQSDQPSMIPTDKDANSAQPSASPSSSKASSFPAVYPPGPQISKTGVPPIALALPYNTGVMHKELDSVVKNPMYELSAKDPKSYQTSNKSQAPTTTSASVVPQAKTTPAVTSASTTTPSIAATSPTSRSAATTKPSIAVKTTPAPSSPNAPVPSAATTAPKPSSAANTSAPSISKTSTTPTTANTTSIVVTKPTAPSSSATPRPAAGRNESHDRPPSLTLDKATSTESINKIPATSNDKLPSSAKDPAQGNSAGSHLPTPNLGSGKSAATQDYMAAAKDLLSSAKQDPRKSGSGTAARPVSPTQSVTINKEELQEKNGKLTSF